MWQRIQTLYLSLSFIGILLMFLFPMIKLDYTNNVRIQNYSIHSLSIFAYEDRDASGSYPILYSGISGNLQAHPLAYRQWHYLSFVLLILSALTILATLFLFKNRLWQLRLCWTTIVLLLTLTILIYMNIVHWASFIGEISSESTLSTSLPLFKGSANSVANRSLEIGSYSLSACLLLLLLSRKQIQKDENLVQSIDRLR